MNSKQSGDQAKFIFTTGRLIHEQILKVQSRHLAAFASSNNSELSLAQWHAVGVVRSAGPLAMGELAELLGISAPSASVMVDRLVEKKLLCREHSMEDRRKVVVRIAPEAIQEIEALEAGLLALFTDLVQRLGPDTTRKWCEVLAAIKKVIIDDDGQTFLKIAE
ncbi:MAG: MarR family transcriptional regulator [Desulfobacteraceae bacterium]|nr:MAG: MarR family transcriptional regulator [Desulfobacteraceae bacterium]